MSKHDIAVVADLHGHFPEIEPSNVLYVAGDICDRESDWEVFKRWCNYLVENETVMSIGWIPGNHDIHIDENTNIAGHFPRVINLCSSPPVVTAGPKINTIATGFCWTFCGNAPMLSFVWRYMTYYLSEIHKRVNNIRWIDYGFYEKDMPVSILVSHGPPAGILDKNRAGESCGTPGLFGWAQDHGIRYILCGHIHERGGRYETHDNITTVNASRSTMYLDYSEELGKCVISGSRWK